MNVTPEQVRAAREYGVSPMLVAWLMGSEWMPEALRDRKPEPDMLFGLPVVEMPVKEEAE